MAEAFKPFTPKQREYAEIRRRAHDACVLARSVVARSLEARLEWTEIRESAQAESERTARLASSQSTVPIPISQSDSSPSVRQGLVS